jgi:ABC-type oligopeptide transport system ATPase subunit
MGEVEVHALRGVDFTLAQGELMVLLGASGSGKSTLLNILGGLNVTTGGRVFYREQELTESISDELTLYRRGNWEPPRQSSPTMHRSPNSAIGWCLGRWSGALRADEPGAGQSQRARTVSAIDRKLWRDLARLRGQIITTKGLGEGDEVVTHPSDGVKDGVLVTAR